MTLLDAIVREIESWSEGYEIKVSVADDGDGYKDFMGLTVTEHGRAKLNVCIQEALIVKDS